MNIKEKLIEIGFAIDNEYLQKYCELIDSNKDREKVKHSTHCHHIIPRYYFEHNRISIDNTSDNLVNLLFKDHILAHYYLANCCNEEYKKSQEEALFFLCRQRSIDSQFLEDLDSVQKLYADLSIRKSDALKGIPRSEETRKKISESNRGKVFSDETKQKLSEQKMGEKNPQFGKPKTPEQRASISNTLLKKKRRWYTNGESNIMIDEDESQDIPNGFYRGMSEETKKKISVGRSGKSSGPLSEETRKKISVSLSGKVVSAETRKKLSEVRLGKPNINARGKKRSEEHKERMRNASKHTKHTDEWKSAMSDRNSGEGNPNYGKRWYTNGEVEILISQDKIPEYESLGYRHGKLPRSAEHREKLSESLKGRKPSASTTEASSLSRKGAHWYTDGESNMLCTPDMDIPKGFYPGMTKNKKQR